MAERHVVGASWDELAVDLYEGTPVVFTGPAGLAAAHREADARNKTGKIPGPGGTLIRADAWAVYELAECLPPGPAPELYYGPPTAQDYCAYQYTKGGRARPDLRCPDPIGFYVKIPDGRGEDWRKARAACFEHLPAVVWQMQDDHGGYRGEYLLRAALPGKEGEGIS